MDGSHWRGARRVGWSMVCILQESKSYIPRRGRSNTITKVHICALKAENVCLTTSLMTPMNSTIGTRDAVSLGHYTLSQSWICDQNVAPLRNTGQLYSKVWETLGKGKTYWTPRRVDRSTGRQASICREPGIDCTNLVSAVDCLQGTWTIGQWHRPSSMIVTPNATAQWLQLPCSHSL